MAGPTSASPHGRRYTTSTDATGRASLWGSVVDCEQGWRASHAYPAHIFVPTLRASEESAARVEAIALALTDYGVPVEILECRDS